MKSPYTEGLEKEIKLLDEKNPFSDSSKGKSRETPREIKRVPAIRENKKNNNYFSLLLDSEFSEIEVRIRGLRRIRYKDEHGKIVEEYEKSENHFLNEKGQEVFLSQLEMHSSPDMKLGYISQDEFKRLIDIFREEFLEYVQDHLNALGMQSYEEQNDGILLAIAIVDRVRMVYSRSINGSENKRSHDDVNVSGKLEGDREDKWNLDDMRN